MVEKHEPEMIYSPALQQFCATWIAWVEGGAPEGKPFLREDGLCYAAERADEADGHDRRTTGFFGPVEKELRKVFRAEFPCSVYPFGQKDYEDHLSASTFHQSAERIDFCRRVAGLQ